MFALKSPGDVARSIPALLGHVPQRSVVVVLLDADWLFKAVMRADLGKACADEALVAVANHAAAGGAAGALVVVVDEEAAPQSSVHRGLLGRFEVAFAQKGVSVWHSFVVDSFEGNGQWWCGDGCGAGGAVGDPATSALGLDAVAHGRRIFNSRAELLAVVAADESRSKAFSAAVLGVDPVEPETAVKYALGVAERIARGVVVSDEELTRVAASLVDVRIRDRLFYLTAKREDAGALQLWCELAKIATGQWRAEVLSVLGGIAFLGSDGPLALVALNAALEAVPAHALSELLLQMLEVGFKPSEVFEALASLNETAEPV
ncbi:Uncharacterised protein [Mycobacteroides abscessus subsp. bolletii]|uniref:DUF4192 domain-containing protein n=1 Tax=Mycobacteroides abscessus TaxID=36809 RepID=UPI0009CA1484|nr:DUF4192 domain-containing protein [Mycobacteroides abscessus]SKY96092.1 Uncharacterised protein [Mycobacteroides abscessus subsp. bolletii]